MRETWNQFLEDVAVARGQLGDPKHVWYRGHANASWSLLPTLFRIPGGVSGIQHERQAFLEFRRTASRLFERRHTDWEILFDMQHYWIPTRLLDWSEVLGIAIAFILHSSHGASGDSVLYILDPLKLNQLSGVPEIKNLPDDANFDYRSIYWEKKPFAPQHPIAIVPPLQSDRMFAQRGVFTIHGDDERPLEDQCSNVVRRVTLPLSAKAGAREFLAYANLDEYSIYPDIVGMSGYLRRKVFGF